MVYTLGSYIANVATDDTYVVTARNDMTIGYLQRTSGGWKGTDILTTMNGRHVATTVRESVTDAFEELLRKGGWRTNQAATELPETICGSI